MAAFRQAFLINLASSSATTAVNFLVSIALARLLTATQLGAYAVALVFVNLVHVLRDFGVSAYLQREPELTPEKIRGALGLLCCTSWLSALLVFAASAPLGRYFGDDAVRRVLQVLPLGMLLLPFGATVAALMLRELDAAPLAVVARIGTAAYAVGALALAWLGFGAMSLAWANVLNIAACSLAYLALRPAGLSWRPSCRNWAGIAGFGAGALLAGALNAVNNALPELLLGRLGSTAQVGLLGRANATVNLFGALAGQAVNFGALSRLADAHRREQSLLPILGRSIALLTGVAWPALAVIGVLGNELVLALFGSRWTACVPAIPALALAAALGTSFNYSGAALTAIGRPRLAALPMAATALARVGLAALLFDGELLSFAWIMLGASMLALPVQLGLQVRLLGQTPASLCGAVWRSLLVALACAGAVLALRPCLPAASPPALTLALAVPLALLAWYGALHLSGHALLGEVHRLLRLRSTIRK